LIRNKKIASAGMVIWISIFIIFAVSNGAGLINFADYIARWLSFGGI
jgi:hypothetical protein